MTKRNYKYWHIVANGFGYYVMAFPDRVVFPNEPDIPTLEKANATRYDVRKYIIERPWIKQLNNVRKDKSRGLCKLA